MRAAIYTGFLLVILCCLLVVATSASAECAWVLWGQVSSVATREVKHSGWGVVRATESAARCEAEKDLYLDPNSTAPPMTRRGDTLVGRGEDSTMIIEAKCLPDTIDPRGPKGK